VLLLVWLPAQVESQQIDEITRRGHLAAEVLDKSSIGGLTVYDRNALDQLAKGYIRSSDFLYIAILDKDRKILADSGLESEAKVAVEAHLPELLKSDGDAQTQARWPVTGERVIHVSRPIFYEQLRLGTVVLGISARRAELQVKQLRTQIGMLCAGVLVLGLGLAFYLYRQLARPLGQLVSGLGVMSDTELETAAGRIAEFNAIVEELQKQRNLFKGSLGELESQKLQLERELAQSHEEASGLKVRVGSMSKQIEDLQEKLRTMEQDTRHLTHILPVVQFATNVAPEIDTSMQHITKSAERLSEDLGRLKNLIDLYEKALPQTPEDLEVIRQYKAFISYAKIRETMDELVTTIRGGASWTEQLADLLKQLASASSVPQVK
jgi:methyl-accepting chemotaxis protein